MNQSKFMRKSLSEASLFLLLCVTENIFHAFMEETSL